MNLRLALLACVSVGTFIAGANLAWQHVQHQELLPDARTASHDLRTLKLRHLGSGALGRLGGGLSGDGGDVAAEDEAAVLSEPEPARPRDYDAGDPRRLTYHVVISSGEDGAFAMLRLPWTMHMLGLTLRCIVTSPSNGNEVSGVGRCMSLPNMPCGSCVPRNTSPVSRRSPTPPSFSSLDTIGWSALAEGHAGAADGSVYNQWQSRICYWHIQRLKAENPHSAMGGFTRLLHRWALNTRG